MKKQNQFKIIVLNDVVVGKATSLTRTRTSCNFSIVR